MMSFLSESGGGVCPAQKKCFGLVTPDELDVAADAPTPRAVTQTASASSARPTDANARCVSIRMNTSRQLIIRTNPVGRTGIPLSHETQPGPAPAMSPQEAQASVSPELS